MKRYFSCLAMILTMLLGTSGVIEGAAGIAERFAAAGVKVGSKTATKLATKIATEEAELTVKFVADMTSSAGGMASKVEAKLADDVFKQASREAAEATLKKAGKEVSETAIEKTVHEMAEAAVKEEIEVAAKAAAKTEVEAATKLMVDSAAKLEKFGVKAESLGVENLSKLGGKESNTALSKAVAAGDKAAVKDGLKAMGVAEKDLDVVASKMVVGEKALARADGGFRATVSNLTRKATGSMSLEAKAMERIAKVDEAYKLMGSASAAERKMGRAMLAKLERGPTMNLARKMGHMGLMGLAGIAGTVYMAVLFMAPSLYQSKLMAEQNKNAMLQTYLPPVKFGNIVLQLPDSVVDMNNPMMSQFVYYGIPVNNPGEKLSSAAKAAYPGVSDPTTKNKLSKSIEEGFTQASSLGTVKKVRIPRYNLDAKALATLPVYVAYSTQSYIPYGSNGIPDAAFSQALLNLNTGAVIFADGTADGTPPVPLVGPKQSSGYDTIQSFMQTKLGNLKTMGLQASYTEFEQGLHSAKAGKVSNPIAAQFDCSCLGSGALSAGVMQVCEAGKSCLISGALNQLAAGLVLNSQGTELQPGQDLATEVANGALGQIIPIQGLGDQLNTFLQAFPGAQKDALAATGALTVSLGADMQVATPNIQGADPDNYAAKGVYVYQCKNTPLAKILRSQSGGALDPNAASQITDYIVFLDANLNQVPLMVPVSDPKNYNFSRMGLNPVIKYFSTIIGSSDGNGGFTFLPQLNIQSPAALVAKGFPAAFAPLYGLQAVNGQLAINYNQNLTNVISGIVQTLGSNPKLGQQFKMTQDAMTSLLTAGPFGKYNLVPVSKDMQPAINGVRLMMYTGFNGYPVAQDAANSACTDVLIPVSAQGKTVTLPANNVTQYYGVVTDLTYTVLADGSITVGANGYTNSAFNPTTWSIDQNKASSFYWLDKLTSMAGQDLPDSLVSFVQNARAAWIAWIQKVKNNPEYLGVKFGVNTLTIASQQALQNGLYIYTCSPCPSASATQDYFVLTNSSAPQASDRTLGSLSATKATSSTNMISLVSGQVYNQAGTPLPASTKLNPATLLKTIQAANPQAIANDLAIKLNIAAGQSATTALAMSYPFAFGGLQLGIYQADLNSKTYLYFDASGAGASANFMPSDYFVSVDSYTSPSAVQLQLSAAVPYMISLVSGQVYGPSGVVATAPSSLVAQIISAVSSSWRPGTAAQIASLTANLSAASQVAATQTDAMNSSSIPGTGVVTWPQSAAMQVINAVSQLDYLADPYSMLKQDPSSGMYVIVAPASTDGTQFLYTFFNVPSSMTDADGNPTQVGATYDGQGNVLRVIQGVELVSMFHQYGVAMDSSGKMYLGASNSLPVLQLDPADTALRPGASGKSMIYSNDAKFPSYGIVSPISYQRTLGDGSTQAIQFHIYYNTLTEAYYAMRVIGSDICYIDMAGGCVYNLNGSPRMAANPVAINSNGDTKDLLLPYLNPNSFVRCVMKNADNNNAYSDFLNSEQDFQVGQDPATSNSCGYSLLYSLDDAASSANLAQMPFPDSLTAMPDLSLTSQYNVYFDGSSTPVTYNVTAGYSWQPLQLLPIDMNSRALLSPAPAAQYSNASLVMQGTKMYAMIFAGQFYSGAQQSGTNAYTMSAGSNKITVSIALDAKTNVQYISVAAGSATYNYQCTFETISDALLADYRHNAWQAETVADLMGDIVLEEYLSIDSSNNLQLVPVNANSVKGAPTDAASKSALSAALGNVLLDSGTGKYVAAIDGSTYAYFTQPGYVDLENGVLFDANGLLVGYTLQVNDMMALLSQVSVSVTRDSNEKPVLMYREPGAAPVYAPSVAASQPQTVSQTPMNAAKVSPAPVQYNMGSTTGSSLTGSGSSSSSSSSSYQAASSGSYGSSSQQQSQQSSYQQPQQSSYDDSSYSDTSYDDSSYSDASSYDDSSYYDDSSVASNVGSGSSGSSSGSTKTSSSGGSSTSKSQFSGSSAASAQTSSANSAKIAAIKKEEERLKAKIKKEQDQLNREKVVNRQKALRNAITMDQNQLAADEKQIAALSAGYRSEVIGRMSSADKKKKPMSAKKSKHVATTKAMKGMTL